MDLNEKLAARRRELAIEAEKAALFEAALRQEVTIQAEKAKKAQQEVVDAEVAKRLAERGIAQPTSTVSTISEISTSVVDAEVEKAIAKAASARITGGEHATFWFLLVLSLWSFFEAWWLGLLFLGCAIVYITRTTERHKDEIITEGKVKVENERRERDQVDASRNAGSEKPLGS